MASTCPSCGFDKEIETKPLCMYCYYRGTVGAAKLLLFQTMRDNGNKYLTIDELTELVNKNPNRKEQITTSAVYKIIRRYSKYYDQAKRRRSSYLVLKKEIRRKKGQAGRPRIKYKLSMRLLKRLQYYEKRWKMGHPINKRVKNGKKFRMTQEYKKRAQGISIKLKKDEYDLYTYILV
ncbi:hypothetical protein [Methanomethylovorans sp.]|uniref:hypothetical protein n=1 Tax=Methanomethylovorans sp. TaxID=2758717 RepID=UPI00351C7323